MKNLKGLLVAGLMTLPAFALAEGIPQPAGSQTTPAATAPAATTSSTKADKPVTTHRSSHKKAVHKAKTADGAAVKTDKKP